MRDPVDPMALPDPERPGFRREGAGAEAARKIASKSARVQAAIHRLLAESGPMTADAVAERLGLPILYIRPRVSELVKHGCLVDSGTRGTNASGMSATKWAAT